MRSDTFHALRIAGAANGRPGNGLFRGHFLQNVPHASRAVKSRRLHHGSAAAPGPPTEPSKPLFVRKAGISHLQKIDAFLSSRPSIFEGIRFMSQHPSLKSSNSVCTKRSVLKRFERVKLMQARGQWKEGRSPIALPKTKPEA